MDELDGHLSVKKIFCIQWNLRIMKVLGQLIFFHYSEVFLIDRYKYIEGLHRNKFIKEIYIYVRGVHYWGFHCIQNIFCSLHNMTEWESFNRQCSRGKSCSCVDHLAGSVHTMAEQWRKCCWGKKEMRMFWVDIWTCL